MASFASHFGSTPSMRSPVTQSAKMNLLATFRSMYVVYYSYLAYDYGRTSPTPYYTYDCLRAADTTADLRMRKC